MHFDVVILIFAALLGLCVIAGKASSKFGIPALLLFVGVGMLAGSDGPGGIWFDDPSLAQHVGIVALALILFSGGMQAHWGHVKKVLPQAISLATIGVGLTAGIVGLLCSRFLGFSIPEGLLIGSVIASTDTAVVFSTLRGSGINLGPKLSTLLELESGLNDPTAVFLTTTLIAVLTASAAPSWLLLPSYSWQMVFGGVGGYLIGRFGVIAMQWLKLDVEALSLVFSIALALTAFAGIELMGGSGFLAVYVAGMTLGNGDFAARPEVVKFHESAAWFMQICMFLVLGLLVFPSKLLNVAGTGVMIALGLMFIARPLGVFIALLPFRMKLEERTFVAWTGLRGAVPIVLATYPLLAGIKRSAEIFDIVFFVVLFSALFQGTTLAWIAKKLGVKTTLAPNLQGFTPPS